MEEKVGRRSAENYELTTEHVSLHKRRRRPSSAPATQDTVQRTNGGGIDQLTVLHVHQ